MNDAILRLDDSVSDEGRLEIIKERKFLEYVKYSEFPFILERFGYEQYRLHALKHMFSQFEDLRREYATAARMIVSFRLTERMDVFRYLCTMLDKTEMLTSVMLKAFLSAFHLNEDRLAVFSMLIEKLCFQGPIWDVYEVFPLQWQEIRAITASKAPYLVGIKICLGDVLFDCIPIVFDSDSQYRQIIDIQLLEESLMVVNGCQYYRVHEKQWRWIGIEGDKRESERRGISNPIVTLAIPTQAELANVEKEQPLIKDVVAESKQMECVICMVNTRCIAFIPCQHMVCCRECSSIQQATGQGCPICRVKIDGVMNIYIS